MEGLVNMQTNNMPIQRIMALLEQISVFSQQEDVMTWIESLKKKNGCQVVAFVNAHAINLAVKNHDFFASLLKADFLLRDGAGMELLYRLVGRNPGLNMNGTDMIPVIIKKFSDRSVAVYGTSSEYIEKSVQQINELGAKVIDYHHGFEDNSFYVKNQKSNQAGLIILGMGMPKQELIAQEFKQAGDNHGEVVICGGAILDFMAKRFPRAPLWVRKIRMEWVFRLMHEPRRLFGRYVIGNMIFLTHALRVNLYARRG